MGNGTYRIINPEGYEWEIPIEDAVGIEIMLDTANQLVYLDVRAPKYGFLLKFPSNNKGYAFRLSSVQEIV